MGYQNLIIQGKADLSIKDSQLVIETGEVAKIPIEDINSLMIENLATTVSAYMLQSLADEGVAVYVCNRQHIPNTVVLPLNKHSRHYAMLKKQIELGKPLQKRLWQRLVAQKIHNQARCLEINGLDGYEDLYRMKKEVQSGDSSHVESKAAAFYFNHLFGAGFSRGEEHVVNAALNYGYAIVRGLIARSVVNYGFEPSIGLFHRSEQNAFNLADDLIEPFRPVVDLLVFTYFSYDDDDIGLNHERKMRLVNVMNLDVLVRSEKHILSHAIDMEVASLNSSFLDKEERLVLPELMNLQEHSYE